ncbi:MAG: hypothetical protein AAGC95_10400, partial [Pseudomonadota bacterium]
EKGAFRQALNAMRDIVESFPDSEVAAEVEKDMNGIFSNLYLDGQAEAMDPVPALALFYENIDLIPSGDGGDIMITRLTDRLISFDLLDQAAELLKHQADNRLQGVPRARAATDLAVVYLMDRRPAEALAAIRSSRVTRLPADLNRKRRILEAKALTELDRHEHALELLTLERGPDIQIQQAEIYWRLEDWSKAGETFEAALGERWRDEAPLNEAERTFALRSAVAYALAGEQAALNRLYAKFSAKMADTTEAGAFDLVSKGVDAGGVRFREIAKEIASLDTLDAFLSGYKERFYGAPPEDAQAAG